MTEITRFAGNGRFSLLGALAGAASTLVFTVIHDVFISNIWSMLLIMLVAGAICGACIGWSYGLLVARPSLRSWLVYNLLYDSMLILLGVVSVLLHEPVTSMAAVSASNDFPAELMGQGLPLGAVFTLLMAIVITWGYGRGWKQFVAVLLTSSLLVLLLGHNVFILGLIDIPSGSLYLVLEMFGLILALNVVYVAVFVLLAWNQLLETTAVSITQ